MKYQKRRISVKDVGKITKKFPLLHSSISKLFNFYIIYIFPLLNIKKLFQTKSNKKIDNIIGKQSIPIIKVNKINLSNRKTLFESLDNINFNNGGWCVYYKDAFKIIDSKLFPTSYKNYDIGIKILINQKLPKKNKNLGSYGLRPFGKLADVKDILRIGNRLNTLEMGPKIFDLILLEDEYGNKAYAYLIENIEGIKIKDIHQQKINKFYKLLTNDKWLKPTWNSTFLIYDFDINNTSENIKLDNKNKFKFIDFQSFTIPFEMEYIKEIVKSSSNTSFGRKRIFSDKNYLYQVLPEVQEGKRDTIKRWNLFDNLFEKSSIKLDKKIICDVGCNLGMNCYYSLFKGASYVYGLDKKFVTDNASLLLGALGCTRYEFIGLDLKNINDLNKIKDIMTNEIDILFYCSIDGHIGYPSQIKNIMFKYILHEGHVGTTTQENYNNLLKNNWLIENESKILFQTYIKDGDSGKRPIILASRN